VVLTVASLFAIVEAQDDRTEIGHLAEQLIEHRVDPSRVKVDALVDHPLNQRASHEDEVDRCFQVLDQLLGVFACSSDAYLQDGSHREIDPA
jgi:hypothetical protein